MELRYLAVLSALGLAAVPAHACEIEPFLFQLPGESEATAEARSEAILADAAIIRKVHRQDDAYEKAATIYLARIVGTSDDPATRARVTKVHPSQAIRGAMPTEDRSLRDEPSHGLCAPVGDGDISGFPAGTYVVVFEGLPVDTYRPRGIDSFAVDSIRNVELLDAISKFGKDLE